MSLPLKFITFCVRLYAAVKRQSHCLHRLHEITPATFVPMAYLFAPLAALVFKVCQFDTPALQTISPSLFFPPILLALIDLFNVLIKRLVCYSIFPRISIGFKCIIVCFVFFYIFIKHLLHHVLFSLPSFLSIRLLPWALIFLCPFLSNNYSFFRQNSIFGLLILSSALKILEQLLNSLPHNYS